VTFDPLFSYLGALTSAPWSMSIWTMAALPALAAAWMGKSPPRAELADWPFWRAYLTRPANGHRRLDSIYFLFHAHHDEWSSK
jgi:hypothetical protein